MAIDWDTAVLTPLMAVFGEAATYTPAASQPGAAPFAITGVFDRAHRELPLLDAEAPANVLHTEMGVRLAQFAVPPAPNDTVVVASQAGASFVVKDVQLDGHGGAKLMLMLTS